jgi:hypothetical protein
VLLLLLLLLLLAACNAALTANWPSLPTWLHCE